MSLELEGRVFSGMGKGGYYVGHAEYQKRFESALGYRPYPGTLNVKLADGGESVAMAKLRAAGGIGVEGFEIGEESFSAVRCFRGTLGGVEIALLLIDVTHYNDTVAELISPTYLRGRFGLKDGDAVSFTVQTS